MSGFTRGWTLAALVAAVAVLVTSIAMAFTMTARDQHSPWWLRNDRAVTSPSGPSAQVAGNGVDVIAMDMGGRRMMGGQRDGIALRPCRRSRGYRHPPPR